MRLAERFSRPVITLIDTPGAYPGVGAEERGQAEAIATNLLEMSALRTPIISVVIGEGGSGGALALGVADHVMMMEFATYSVISPEGCAAILWKDGSMADAAASSLKMTSTDLMGLKLIDNVIKEPLGAAHRNLAEAAASLKTALLKATKELSTVPFDELVDKRYAKFRKMGAFKENARED
jgi:acetyl-CoA carboxylase carboxyl transferase subunit alpha